MAEVTARNPAYGLTYSKYRNSVERHEERPVTSCLVENCLDVLRITTWWIMLLVT